MCVMTGWLFAHRVAIDPIARGKVQKVVSARQTQVENNLVPVIDMPTPGHIGAPRTFGPRVPAAP